MCQYIYHHFIGCGHIGCFSLDTCFDMMNALRISTPPPSHGVTAAHDLLPLSCPTACPQCERESTEREPDNSTGSKNSYIQLEGLSANTLKVVSHMEISLSPEYPASDSSFVHVGLPSQLEPYEPAPSVEVRSLESDEEQAFTPCSSPRPSTRVSTISWMEQNDDNSQCIPPLHRTECTSENTRGSKYTFYDSASETEDEEEEDETVEEKGKEEGNHPVNPYIRLTSPSEESHRFEQAFDEPLLHDSQLYDDVEPSPPLRFTKTPARLSSPSKSPHRLERPVEAPLKVSDLYNDSKPTEQPTSVKMSARLKSAFRSPHLLQRPVEASLRVSELNSDCGPSSLPRFAKMSTRMDPPSEAPNQPQGAFETPVFRSDMDKNSEPSQRPRPVKMSARLSYPFRPPPLLERSTEAPLRLSDLSQDSEPSPRPRFPSQAGIMHPRPTRRYIQWMTRLSSAAESAPKTFILPNPRLVEPDIKPHSPLQPYAGSYDTRSDSPDRWNEALASYRRYHAPDYPPKYGNNYWNRKLDKVVGASRRLAGALSSGWGS
ncbi:uncharacterized protein BO80DRAFT_449078 [Aspergillus ibericus CBS 121593]|uniref:Uncharacterized protein n=1 Tax=Aspergillus ibericus CBS 121593 TaxID=1448316 RepID=A0A395GNU3_9EURO|nr:hypothetical protein BO80DRAFT_449078 [Aspergillus ibericus CBS 121593]RAK96618.1 hypothetical protein BO80DRAFT_449078 [Aspergillus ibericus CBS 121593]